MGYDIVIIGSGPAGYVAAIRAGQLGLKTAIVEKSKLGGMCLNWGCIPSKALLESAKKLELVKGASDFGIDGIEEKNLTFNWKRAVERSNRIVQRLTRGVEYLMKKNGVEIIYGEAHIQSETVIKIKNKRIESKNIIIATGSKPTPLDHPVLKKISIEIEDMLKREKMLQSPMVFGHNPFAVELAQFFKLSGKEVKLVLPGEQLLPDLDPFLSHFMEKVLRKNKIEVINSSEIKGYKSGMVIFEKKQVPCDGIINASQRDAILPESRIKFLMDGGFIKVNEFLQTSIKNIYAIGDVNGKSEFAHAASAQGRHAVNVINGIREEMDLGVFPINMYTLPEIAQLGITESEAQNKKIDYKVSEFPLSANGKALIEGYSEGLIRMISEKKYGEVIGIQIIAPHATDMIGEAAALMQLEGTVYDVAKTIHAHPTISEIFVEAGLDAFEQAIHK